MNLLSKTFLLLSSGVMFLTACNDNTNETSDNTDTSVNNTNTADTSTTESTATTTAANPDQDAINYLVPKNESEIAALKAGIAKGSLKDIKDHSKMMLADHTKLKAEVAAYLSRHPELVMPAVDTTNADAINDKQGKEWDKAWTTKLIEAHEEILGKLDEAEKNVKDEELRKMASKTKVTVQHHLDMAKMIDKKL